MFKGAVPAIIDSETWHNVRRLMETRCRSPEKQRHYIRHFYEKALAVGGVFC